MLSVEDLIEPITTKALISRVYNYSLLEKLYTVSNKSLLSIKHVIKNHIWVEEASELDQGTYIFTHKKSLHHPHQSST